MSIESATMMIVNFNPRSRKGSDVISFKQSFHPLISIHAPARGATRNTTIYGENTKFQSTLPQGERLSLAVALNGEAIFQSTLPQGERPKRCLRITSQKQFQSTLPQGERPRTLTNCQSSFLFQSTLPQGERPFLLITPLHLLNFNPRSRKGSDAERWIKCVGITSISIHAPARGATSRYPSIKIRAANFNPRSRKGSDRYLKCIWMIITKFQSTLPQGERPIMGPFSALASGISIHAPARGATRGYGDDLVIKQDFNPRSRKGSDHFPAISCRIQRYFNPRSRKGSDRRED